MHSIYVMAAVTIVVSAAVWGAMLYVLPGRTTRYLWPALLGLPLSAVVNLVVKRPVGTAVADGAGIDLEAATSAPWWFIAFLLLLPPVSEELVKVLPLVWDRARCLVTDGESALWTGAALGIGFGLGEAGYVAFGVAQSPDYSHLPWYAFTGFFYERLAVCYGHGVMTAIAVVGMRRGARWGLIGLSAAMGLHVLGNLGAFLLQFDLIGEQAAGLWFVAVLIGMTFAFETMRRRVGARPLGEDPDELCYYTRPGGSDERSKLKA